MKKIRLLSTVLLVVSFSLAAAQTVGDYRSVVNGNWGTIGTWETYNGSAWVAASAVPPVVPPYANITIQAGDTVIVEASPKRAASLKVEGTAMLYANSTTNRYVRLWGNVTNDGTVGASADGLCYMCSTSVFIDGMGSTDIARLQIAAANVSVTVSSPITLHYAGAGLYGNNVDNVTYNVIEPGGQVNFGPSTYVGITTSSNGPSPYNATYNLYAGSFKLQAGMNFNISVRSGKKAILNLYSGLTLGDTLFAYSDSSGTEVVNINENGGITFSAPFSDTLRFDSLNINSSADYWPPCPGIIKGGLGLFNGMCQNYPVQNLTIGKNATINRGSGVFYAKPVFTDTFNLIYSGSIPCTTSYEMPKIEDNIVPNLAMDHELFVDTSRMVNNLTANGGPIVSSNGYFGVLGSFNKNSTDGYVIGYMGRQVPVWAAGQDVHFAVGTSQGYTPAVVHFNNVSKSGLLACMSNDGEHASAAVPQQTLKRWWNLGWRPDSIATFDDYGLDLTYLSSDFNADLLEADDELNMVAGKHDAGWAFPAIASRDTANNTIQLSGLIDFSDFTMAKNQNSLAPDTIAPFITATYPADGATEVALNTLMYVAFSEAVDTLSVSGTINPVPSPSYPTWNPTMDTMFYVHGDLETGTTYTLEITALNDLSGNPLVVLPDSFMFTTIVGDTVKPYIVSTSPADGASDVALDAAIYIAFSEPVDTLSLAGSMTPSPNEYPFWNASMDTLFLSHDPMSMNTVYNVKLTALNDLAGNPLAALPDSFMFTTTVGDTVKPYIVSVSPAWGAVDVGLNDTIVIAFSEPMNTDSLDGYTNPFHDFTPGWNAAGDTFTLIPQDPYPYSTVMSVIITSGIDLAGNSIEFLPDTVVQFTSSPFKGPEITLVQQPGDTYDGTGPFIVRAAITDLGKAGIAADTLWYTDNATDWWAVVHSSTDGDTFNYSIPGPLAAGTVIEFFFGAWDDGGAVQYDPGMYRGYQFRILSPLAPSGLSALGGNLTVDLTWTPPAQVLSYYLTNNTGFFQDAGNIVDTRFTPQHYPCKLEQAVSSWWDAAGLDSVELHVWADDGSGLPDRSAELVPPVTIMPLDYPAYTVVDLSAQNLVLSSGDFHIGYVIRTDNMPMPLSDSDGPGIRSLVYDSSAAAWGNLISGGTTYHDWSHESAVSYHDYSKGLALKSYLPKPGARPLAALADLKPVRIENKQAAVYPGMTGALFLAKNIAGYDLLRSNVSGGPYTGLSKVNDTTYTDTTVLNNNTYYYVVRAVYSSPDTFSAYSNEASATPTGVAGKPESQVYTLQLKSVAPNPMTTGRTTFKFSLPVSAQASLEVFNVLGQKVNTLFDGKLEAGNHAIDWNGTDRNGARLASGVYIYQLRTMNRTLTKRMTILR